MNTSNTNHQALTGLRITWLGAGLMGVPMALRLVHAGAHVNVWNRSAGKTEVLLAAGAKQATDAAAAVAQANITISMLTDGAATHALLQSGVLAALPPASLFLNMASTQPKEAKTEAAWLAERGVLHLDAPVSGGTLGAEQGTLAILCGGGQAAFDRAAPVLATLGRATLIGPTGSGQLAKLANQLIVGVSIAAVAEAMLLIERGGASPARFKEAIAGGFADSRVMQVHGERMVQGDFAKRAAMSVQLKDMNNIAAEGRAQGALLPTAQTVRQLYEDACATPLAELDHSALHQHLLKLRP